jgi:hypothetical protein
VDHDIFFDVRSEVSIGDIKADYDKDGGGNEQAAEEGVNDINFDDSVMMAYCRALQQQMQLELSKNPGKKGVQQFLVKEIARNNYILPRHRVHFYCRQLNMKFQEIGYYHDVHVWLPHEQWGVMFMPTCKNCKCGTNVRQNSEGDDSSQLQGATTT